MQDIQEAAFSATKILLPIDFSPSSEAAIDAATGLAQQFHADIHLVHIIPEIPDFNGSDFFPETAVLQERKETIEEKLDACRERLVRKGVAASFSIESGNDIVGSLMRVIKHEHIDMLVISTHGLSGWRPFVAGSIASQLIKQVDCTLLLLRSHHHKSASHESIADLREGIFLPLTGVTAEIPAEKRLDQNADHLAEQGGRTENKFDQAHSLVTK